MMNHSAINNKGFIREFIPANECIFYANMWQGMCHEISSALFGDKDHIVEKHNGKYVIWRKNYMYPHFFEQENGRYCCPWWNQKTKKN